MLDLFIFWSRPNFFLVVWSELFDFLINFYLIFLKMQFEMISDPELPGHLLMEQYQVC